MEVGLLGPFRVIRDGKPLALGGYRQRAVLAVLSLNLNRSVGRDRLIDLVWPSGPPDSAAGVIQTYLANLRKLIEPKFKPGSYSVLLSRAGGYELALPFEAVDIHQFDASARIGREALERGEAARAEKLLGEALSLWRGPALGEFAAEPFAAGEVARLNELRLRTEEDRIEARLASGRHSELVGEIRALLAEHPLRERLSEQLMIALYRDGRQAEASEVFHRTRALLVDELGMEPGTGLQKLLKQILNHDQELDLALPTSVGLRQLVESPRLPDASVGEPSVERKLVTVLFADVVGSTDLVSEHDPEVSRAVMRRYFESARTLAETHGGRVEKFVGDAVMVVFGLPRVHDDDAERAVRAALAIRDTADGELNLVLRIGINSGEAVTTAGPEREFMVSGESVNIAARLQQGAEPGEVLVGEVTERLTRAAIEYLPRPPVAVKGRTQPIVAFAAVQPRTARPEQIRGLGMSVPFVGRKREMSLILETYARVSEDRRGYLITVLGAAGVGKSRLVNEAVRQMQGTQIHRGRCLPYGSEITWWCFAELVRVAAAIDVADEHSTALRKLDEHLQLVANGDERQAVRGRLLVMLGLLSSAVLFPDATPKRVNTEISWAVRRYLEALAAAGPVVIVIDDLQWAEDPVIDAFQQLTGRVLDVPLLLICIGRPEVLEQNPAWSASKPNAANLTVEPLNRAQTMALIAAAPVEGLTDELANVIAERSEGTPLFCEELLAMVATTARPVADGGRWSITGPVDEMTLPHSVQAVLAARIDALDLNEKAVLRAASVIGERFSIADLRALVDGPVDAALESLIRKSLVAEDREQPELGGLRFRHMLIRDAAYESSSKVDRASLHERYGVHLERQAGDPGPLFDVVLHHAERAFELSSELTIKGVEIERRAQRAYELALGSGYAAIKVFNRKRASAASSLASKANAARAHSGKEAAAEVAVLSASADSLTDLRGGQAALLDAARLAAACGRLDLVAKAKLRLAWIGHVIYNEVEDATIVREAIEACAKARDYPGELSARALQISSYFPPGELSRIIEEGSELKSLALTTGELARAAQVLSMMIIAAVLSGRGSEAEAWGAEAVMLCQAAGLVLRRAWIELILGELAAFHGNPQANVDAAIRLQAVADVFGSAIDVVGAGRGLGEAHLRNGALSDAKAAFETALNESERVGERWDRTEIYVGLSTVALSMGNLETADRRIRQAIESVVPNDLSAASYAYRTMGQIQVASGRYEAAESSLRTAVNRVAESDYRVWWAEALAALGMYCSQRGYTSEALAAADQIESFATLSGYTWLNPTIEVIRNSVIDSR
jgi:DNA-binding SARP family transcriptional activator/tetratricopeptide (TPR) repeat protein